MPASKIVDHGEVKRWFEEGKTYQEMCEIYLEKYHIETVPSMWGNYRRRHGLTRRFTRDDELIPWLVEKEHRYAYPIAMLRLEARRRTGKPIRDVDERRLDSWIARLQEDGTVVHYDPDAPGGWFYVPRREGIDTDLIRVPDRVTTRFKAAD